MPRVRAILLFLGGMLLLLLGSAFWIDREPKARGRPLTEWFATYLKIYSGHLTRPGVQETRDAVREIGTNALPWLIEWTLYERPAWKDTLLARFEKLPRALQVKYVRYFIDKEREDRKMKAAAFGFEILGPIATPATPSLTPYAFDGAHNPRAIRVRKALQQIGQAAVPVFTCIVTNSQATNRLQAIYELGEMGEKARPALPALLHCLRDPNQNLAGAAAETLGRLRLEPATILPALTELVRSSDDRLRRMGLDAIYSFGEDAGPAIPVLLECLNDPDDATARKATTILQMVPFNREAVGVFANLLQNADPDVRKFAIGILGLKRPMARFVVPALAQCVTNSDSATAVAAVRELGRMNSEPDLAVPALTNSLRSLDRGLRAASLDAIQNFGNAGQTAVPALLETLHDDDLALRLKAFETLIRIAPKDILKRREELERLAEQNGDDEIRGWPKTL